MNNEFNSINDLYIRVLPALKIKKRELNKKGIKINEKEIFEDLIKTKWIKEVNIALNEIVNDILNYQVKDF